MRTRDKTLIWFAPGVLVRDLLGTCYVFLVGIGADQIERSVAAATCCSYFVAVQRREKSGGYSFARKEMQS